MKDCACCWARPCALLQADEREVWPLAPQAGPQRLTAGRAHAQQAVLHVQPLSAWAAQTASSARQEISSLQQGADEAGLEDKKAQRLQKLKGSTPDALQIMREAMGDSAGHVLAASHGQVAPCVWPALLQLRVRLAAVLQQGAMHPPGGLNTEARVQDKLHKDPGPAPEAEARQQPAREQSAAQQSTPGNSAMAGIDPLALVRHVRARLPRQQAASEQDAGTGRPALQHSAAGLS